MLALTAIQLCARDYNDIAYARIARDATSAAQTNQANWLDWLNDAVRAVVAVRPDAGAAHVDFTLTASETKQTLPAGAIRLLGVTRNIGAAGGTIGKAIRFSTDRDLQDDINKDWHTATVGTYIREVIYDEKRDPLHFWVSPRAPSSAWHIELITCQVPTAVSDANVLTGSFQLPDVYAPAAQDWMLYRAYAMQAASSGSWTRAMAHFQSFFNVLGVKLRGELWTGPKANEGFPAAQAKAA